MISVDSPLVLASASPRRREILSTLRIPHRVVAADVDESPRSGESPATTARRLAGAKAEAVAAWLEARGEHERWVLGADTVVVVDGAALGKPSDDDDARRMMTRLVGRRHDVTTAFALRDRATRQTTVWQATTRVAFRSLRAEEIEAYVSTGEGRDKAGAYAVQGIASGFVTSIEGSFTNVVGLPASEVVTALLGAGALGRFPA